MRVGAELQHPWVSSHTTPLHGAGEGPLASLVASGASAHNLALVITELSFVVNYVNIFPKEQSIKKQI